MSNIRACGHVLDKSGSPVVGKVYFYNLFSTKGHHAVMHEDGHGIVGPGTDLYEYTELNCDAIPGNDPGWFDFPDGLPAGEYALHVHHGNGLKEWAWPFVVSDGKPQNVSIGGPAEVTPGPVPGPDPVPGNYPSITPLDKQFTKGTFTAAISYYGMFGAPLDRIKRDLDKARRAGFGNARVWVDWAHPKEKPVPNARLTNSDGSLIESKAKLLDDVLAFCLQIGMSLDLTMETAHYKTFKESEEGYNISAHKNALKNILTRWGKHPCVKIIDVDNEAEVRRPPPGSGSPEGGHTSPGRFAELMEVAKSIPHTCLVSLSASSDGEAYKASYNDGWLFRSARGDILLPHMRRVNGWGANEGKKGKDLANAVGGKPILPVYHQEPARNSYNGQNWPLNEFEQSFKTTKANGAVGCCFHTGAGFRLEQKDMFDQFDSVEKQVIANVYNWIK